jgi:hypothetical protein
VAGDSDFYLEVPKRSTLSSSFMDRSYTGVVKGEGEVAGSILDGEDEPEFVGKFTMRQIMSAAALGGGSITSEDGEWNGEVDEDVWFDDE